MGFFDWLLGGQPLAIDDPSRLTFAVDTDAVDPATFGLTSYVDTIAPVGRVPRPSAVQVPAVKRARDLICGTLGGIPLRVVNGSNEPTDSPLMDQPEKNVPRSVTMTRTYEDLLFEGIAWWRIVATNYRGYPVTVQRLTVDRVDVRNDGRVYVDGRPVQHDQLIRFDSPNDPLLAAGGRAIRTLLKLEAAAARYSDEPMPSGYFAPVDGADPIDDEDVAELLADWQRARQSRATGYVPAALKYEAVQFSPEQLQMGDARQHAVLEIARLTGISAEDLSVSTTSRTYFNSQDARLQRISDVLGPYVTAVTDRLRMRDVTPLGYEVQADFSGFLKADDATRLGNYAQGIALGLYTLPQVAEREGVPAPASAPATRPVLRAVPESETA